MPLSDDSEALGLFRQIPYDKKRSKPGQTRGNPVRIGEIGDAFIKKLAARAGGERGVLAKNWGTIVPKRFLNKSVPERVRSGVLYVRAQNAAVKQELSFLKRAMIEKIRLFPLCGNIKDIKIL